MEFRTKSHLFKAYELEQIDAVFSVEYNFDTPVLSAVFKPKMDAITEDNWNVCMDILHEHLPLKEMKNEDGGISYIPFYEDNETWNKSLDVLLALKEFRERQKPQSEDAYYYGSKSNKIMQMEYLNRYFDVVRFPVNGAGVWQYALQPVTENATTEGKKVLSEYIDVREIKIAGTVYYDALHEEQWPLFYKVVSDLETYQKQLMIETTNNWNPIRVAVEGVGHSRPRISRIRD